MISERYDAFLSYARSDDERFVKELYEHLTSAGFSIWWDRENMPNRGETFLREIQHAIDRSDRLIAVIGPTAVKSAYVRNEWDYAQLVCKVVIPILRIGVSLEAIPGEFRRDDYTLIPPDLKSFHCPDFRPDRPQADAMNELDRILRQTVIEPGTFHYVPALPPNFLPRREVLGRLGDALLADTFRPVTIDEASKQTAVLHGMAGTGKSVMASAFARSISIRRSFSDGAVWLRIGQNPDSLTQWKLLAAALEDDPEHYLTVEDAEGRLEELLREKKCLIILDDVWNVRHVEPLWNALGVRCRLLVTSRNASVATSLNARGCLLEELTSEEALALLSQWVDLPVEELPASAGDVMRECGNLPLALSLCGALVRDKTPWEDLLDGLRDADLAFITHDLVNYEHPNIMRALQTSVDFLARSDPGAPARYAELAVFLHPPQIPEAAVLTLWCADRTLSTRSARRLLAELDRKALLRLEGESPHRRVWLHDLERTYIRAKAKQLGPLDAKLLAAYEATSCPMSWPSGPNDGYYFERLPCHLKLAGREQTLQHLLLDLRWLRAKLNATDIYALISDYDLMPAEPVGTLLQGALQLSTHVLANDKTQLAGQLTGRLREHEDSGQVQRVLDSIAENSPRPWLNPLWPFLTAPAGPLVRTLLGHTDAVNAVALTPDGQCAISASSDQTLKVWDLANGKEIRTLRGHTDRVNAVTLIPNRQCAISASSDRTLKVWDLASGEERHTLTGHRDEVYTVVATPDGCCAISGSKDGTIRIWDLATGDQRAALLDHPPFDGLSPPPPWVRGTAITPDGSLLIARFHPDPAIRVWNLETGQELPRLENQRGVYSLTVTPCGCRVAACSATTLKMWDLSTGTLFETYIPDEAASGGLGVSPDGRFAVFGTKPCSLIVWDLDTGKKLRTLTGHAADVNTVAVMPDCRHVASASNDGTLRIWDLAAESRPASPTFHLGALAVDPGGQYIIAVDDSILKILDLKSGAELAALTGHKYKINAVAVTPDGCLAVSASDDARLRIWDLKARKGLHTLAGHRTGVLSVAVMPDGRHAVSGAADHFLKVWDLNTGREVRTLEGHIGWVFALAGLPNGREVIFGSGGHLRLWNLETGGERLALRGADDVMALTVTPDGRYVLTAAHGTWDLKVWDLENTTEPRTLSGHVAAISALAMMPGGLHAVSVSRDRTLKVWDTKTWSEIATFTGDAPLSACAAGPQNIIVAADNVVEGGTVGRLHVLRLEV